MQTQKNEFWSQRYNRQLHSDLCEKFLSTFRTKIKAHLALPPLEKRRTYVSSGKATRVSRLSCSVWYNAIYASLTYSLLNLRNYRYSWSTKSHELCVKQMCLPSKLYKQLRTVKLWKPVFNPTRFQIPQMQSDFICLQVFPAVPRFVFAFTFLIFIAGFHFSCSE